MNNGYSAVALRWVGLAALCFAVGCAAPVAPSGESRLKGPQAGDLQRILAPPRPPRVIANVAETPQISARTAARLTFPVLEEQRGARLVQIAAVPLLRSTPEGAAFLAMTGHRALAQGEPPESCPALSHAPQGAPTPVAAGEASLTKCTGELRRRGVSASCGCRLIALDDALLAPITRFSFAPSVSALLIADGDAMRLIAEVDIENGVAVTHLRSAVGEVGVLRTTGANDHVGGVINDVAYTGTRKPFGFRRGRLAERLTMTSAAGDQLTLLIGVERRDATPKS